jgi:quercetin dioxygenase-like cupin family protein
MRHIRLGYLYQGTFATMYDDSGQKLIGVTGKEAVRALKRDETFIGADFIRIEPGHGFKCHTHDGDHILHVIEGRGIIAFDGNDIELYPGNVVFVPAEYPHAMRVPEQSLTPMLVLAIGHPHREISSHSRSRAISESHDLHDKIPPARARPGIDSRS